MLVDVKSFRSETIKLVVFDNINVGVFVKTNSGGFLLLLSLILCVKFFPQMTFDNL